MNPEAQEVFDQYLKISPENLNPDQRAFLRARRTYLNKAQVEYYKEVLEAEETPIKVEEFEEEAVDYKDLLTRAKDLGYTGGRVKRAELEDFIRNAEEEKKKQNPFE